MESPEGWNKSSVWAVLAGEGNFSDERIIGKDSREVVEQLSGIWIHENADLAGMRKAEVETVKAYASRVEDRARPAYGHYLIAQPRHSIEVGTTNNDEYLQSQTGNRRFWPMRLTQPIDIRLVRSLRLQIWGEAAARQSGGEALTLDEDLWAAAGAEQEARRVRDPWEDRLAHMLDAAATVGALENVGQFANGLVQREGGDLRVTAAALFDSVLSIPDAQRYDVHAKRLANCMRVLGWRKTRFRSGGRIVRGYTKPENGI
jgi:predicted P-loop ATPase